MKSRHDSLIHLLVTISLLLSGLYLLTGCEEDSDNIWGILPQPAYLIAIAGDATLQTYDPHSDYWLDPVGLGLGANWMSSGSDFELFVLNSTSHTLQQLEQDGSGIQTVATIDLGLQRNTSPFAFTRGLGKTFYVTNLLENSVSVVDFDENEIIDSWPVGRAPEGILHFYDAENQEYELYVVNSGYDFSDFSFHTGSIYQLDPDDGTVIDSLELGMNPQFFRNKYFDELHVVCTGNYGDIEGEIWILGTNPLTLKHVIDIGHSPGRLTFDYQLHTAYIAGGGWSNDGDEEGLILSYDMDSYAVKPSLSASLGVVDVLIFDGQLYALCRDAMRLDVFQGIQKSRVESLALQDPPNCLVSAFHEEWADY